VSNSGFALARKVDTILVVQNRKEGDQMQFVLGVFLFVVVVGIIDARLPWPMKNKRSKQS
jgi:hypothetical protein